MKEKGDPSKRQIRKVRKMAKKAREEKAYSDLRKFREGIIPIMYQYSNEPTPAMSLMEYDTMGEQVRAKMALRDRAKEAFKANRKKKQ